MLYDTSDTVIKRIGKVQTNFTRPLKLTLKSASHVKWILKNREKIMPSGVACASDKTLRQQEYYKSLKDQLDARQKDGEKDLKIKYVKGVPRIVTNKSNENSDSKNCAALV